MNIYRTTLYIFVFDLTAHLAVFNPIVLYRRMVAIRDRLKAYFHQRNLMVSDEKSRSVVAYKTMSYTRGGMEKTFNIVSSSVVKRLTAIVVFVLKDLEELIIVNVWDMGEAVYDCLADLHPPTFGKCAFVLSSIVKYLVDCVTR